MTQEELKKRAEDLGQKVKAKYDELMKAHWDNTAKALCVPDGESVNAALSKIIAFLGNDCGRSDAFAGEYVRIAGADGDHDPKHFNCVCRLSSKISGSNEVYLYVRCFHPGDKPVIELADIPFMDRGRLSTQPRYSESLPYVNCDFSDAEDEVRLSRMFKGAVESLKELKRDLEIRDAFYPNMYKAVSVVMVGIFEESRKVLDNAEEALDNL